MRPLFRYSILVLALCAGVIWLLGCLTTTATETNGTPTSYFPLTQGNRWVYQQLWPDGSLKKIMTAELGAATSIGSGTAYPLYIMDGAQTTANLIFFLNQDAEGVRIHQAQVSSLGGYATYTGSSPLLLLPASAPTPQQWTLSGNYTLTSNGSTLDSGMIKSTPVQIVGTESVTVPAGTFPNAIKCTATLTDPKSTATMEMTYWFAPGVGLVKGGPGDSQNLTLVLQSYSVK
jgi:hypothetical protein